MDNLQYHATSYILHLKECCFKPYYKWITFNTEKAVDDIPFLAF